VLATAPREDASLPPQEPNDYKSKWSDIDYLLDLDDYNTASVHWMGDIIPATSAWSLGWCQNYGFPISFQKDTLWMEHSIADWNIEIAWDNLWRDEWWLRALEYTERSCIRAQGKYYAGAFGQMPPNDHLSTLRGADKFLVDLIDKPEIIKNAQRTMTQILLRMHRELYAIRRKYFDGSLFHYPIWCPDYVGTWQSDVSAMISPDMYKEFILPELQMAADEFDKMIYHLDGPDAIKHLGNICSIEKIHLIQWVPGAGQPWGAYWLDLYKRIQSYGKAVLIYTCPEEVELLIRELDPAKTVLQFSVPSHKEGIETIENICWFTKKYHG